MEYFPEVRFQCQYCAVGCCSRFEVTVNEEERKRIEGFRMTDVPPPEVCFLPQPDGKGYLLAKDPETGNCVFADGNRCKIHTRFGYAMKPLSCRIFPLHLQQWSDGKTSAEYRFVCPGVASAKGKTRAEEHKDIAKLMRELQGRSKVVDAAYSAENPAPLEKIRMVHQAFRELLHDESEPLALRLYGAARILAFHSSREMHSAISGAGKEFAADAVAFFRKAEDPLKQELAQGKIDALVRANFRNLVCGYLRSDLPGAGALKDRLRRTWTLFRISSGLDTLQALHKDAPAVPGTMLPWKNARFTLTPEAKEIFRMFFYGKLDAMHFCGGMTHFFHYEDGLRHLLLAAPVTFSLAAGYAWSREDTLITAEDMRRSVVLTDATFGRSPFFRLRIAQRWIRHLSNPAAFAGLLQGGICDGI